MHVTKKMLGNKTRKSILYLDQNFFSSVHRGSKTWVDAMAKVDEIMDLQLLAIPYSRTHERESGLVGVHRDGLVKFIQEASRGNRFEPHWNVEKTQILKGFHAYLDRAPAAYQQEEIDALCESVHDWDRDYLVSMIFSETTDVDRKLHLKNRSTEELLAVLPQWSKSKSSFDDDMRLEVSDHARILVENFANKHGRLVIGDVSALFNSPINTSVVEGMWYVLDAKKVDPTEIGAFFRSSHFAELPSVQLSARLYSTFKKRMREGMFPNSQSPKTRKGVSGFLADVEHVSTYAPYCSAFFTDNSMARLMNDRCVSVERDFGCKVFSYASMTEFLAWLESLRTNMTAEHATDLGWAYPKYRVFWK